MKKIYLDYNATTPVAPSVFEEMRPFFSDLFGNSSSTHSLGRAAAEAIEDSRSKVAGMIGCEPEELVFTSGGSEANNHALKGVLLNTNHFDGHIIISSVEHPAVTVPARFLERLGFELTLVGCDSNGVVDPDDIRGAIRPDTAIVSIMHSNNEVGTLQPIAEIGSICRERDVLFHTDASQSGGKVDIDVHLLNVDLLTLAGHKFYGPKGVGALFVRTGVSVEPLVHGSGHQRGTRAGTENTPLVVGLGAAARLAGKAVAESSVKMAELRDRLVANLRQQIDGLIVHAEGADRLPNTASVSFPGVSGPEVLSRIPEISASTGSACQSGSEHSSTLSAMGIGQDIIRGTLRLSVGWHTSHEEIERASSLLIDAWENLHQPA